MSNNTAKFSQEMPCSNSELFKWHTMPRAFQRLIPPWENVKILEHPEQLETNSNIHILLDGLINWKLKIKEIREAKSFTDEQQTGPFKSWSHKHSIQVKNENSSNLIEEINFELPFAHNLLAKAFIKNKLEPGFNYRFRTIANDIKLHKKYNLKTQRILITGASGLVGSALFDFLSSGGHQVYKLVRQESKANDEITWNPEKHEIDSKKLESFDTVIHLAGENIASKRWSKKQKQKIRDSRINGTKFLVDSLNQSNAKPKTFICASAIGFYGSDSDKVFDESTSHSDDFLARTCQEWEEETKELKDTRVVNTRFGIILDPRSGALAKMLPIFKLGAGGNLGNGKQWMSWIALDDVIGAILHCIAEETIEGPVNFTSPNSHTNKEFTKILAKVLCRPAILPAPSIALTLALGEMADALLLSSCNCKPSILATSGYDFAYPDLEAALRHMLGK